MPLSPLPLLAHAHSSLILLIPTRCGPFLHVFWSSANSEIRFASQTGLRQSARGVNNLKASEVD